MLDTMRSLSKSIVSKLLMAFLVISFGVWGVGDIVRSGGQNYAAKVGQTSIGLNEWERERRILQQQLEESGMKNLPAGIVEQSVMRKLVQQKLNLLAMEDIGLSVNEALLAKKIAAIPSLRGPNGKFDAKLYQAAIKGQGLSEQAFLAELRKEFAADFMADSLNAQDIAPPAPVLALEAIAAGETRDAVILTVSAQAPDKADETAMRSYYDENKSALYMNPERRTLEFVVLSKADLAKKSSDEGAPSLSAAIEDALAAGSNLSEALKAAGVNAPLQTLTDMTLEKAASISAATTREAIAKGFTLGEGEVSDLTLTKDGAAIIVAVKAITPATPKAFEEVRADVKSRTAKQLARDAAQAKAAKVKQALAASPDWQAVANEQNLSTRVVSRVARPADGKPSGALPPSLHQAIFERGVGEIAGPLTLDTGDQVLALVTRSYLPATAAASDTTKERIRQQLGSVIENRAYLSFGARHEVEINPAVLKSQAGSE